MRGDCLMIHFPNAYPRNFSAAKTLLMWKSNARSTRKVTRSTIKRSHVQSNVVGCHLRLGKPLPRSLLLFVDEDRPRRDNELEPAITRERGRGATRGAGSLAAHIEALLKLQLSRAGLAFEGAAEDATITMTTSPSKSGAALPHL